MPDNTLTKRTWLDKFLDGLERVCNKLPPPAIMFIYLFVIVAVISFAPLGLVITMTLAIGMCEESGLIMALLQDKLRNVPPVILPFVVAFVGTVGNLASDTAMVVIPPIAAILYIGAGKHPLAGMICGYAGAQAGFSANLMIAGTDALRHRHRRGVQPGG